MHGALSKVPGHALLVLLAGMLGMVGKLALQGVVAVGLLHLPHEGCAHRLVVRLLQTGVVQQRGRIKPLVSRGYGLTEMIGAAGSQRCVMLVLGMLPGLGGIVFGSAIFC